MSLLTDKQRHQLAELAKVLSYDPETGEFRNKVKRSANALKGEIAGNVSKIGYVRIWANGKSHYAHVLAFLFMKGRYPLPGHQVDHVNHDRADNRWNNLREVKRIDNQRNKRLQKNNKTGINGLYWSERDKTWSVRIVVKKQDINLGSFKGKFEACCARKSAEKKYGFHPNHGRDAA